MPVYTVTAILADVARPILVAATSDPDLSVPERAVAADRIPIVDSVLGDLNAQHLIPQTGRRNAAVTNLRDAVPGLNAVDRTHENFAASRLYNACDAFLEAADLIARQVPTDEVFF